ncbi:MAG: hypothetical protein K6F35_04230 [Lachnospiraceae bacterium]|nr:hypothetical protein [Lachnospiraceae bacterium]
MNQDLYRKALDRCIRRAHEQHNHISEEDYRQCFDGLGMNETEDRLTRDYLGNIHIRFGEYAPEEEEEPELPEGDGTYLRFYLEELEGLPAYTKEEALQITARAMEDDGEAKKQLLSMHLKDVVEIAKLYVYQSLPLEDLIGEGNIGLMAGVDLIGCITDPGEAEGHLGSLIMDAMDAAIARDTDERQKFDDMLMRIGEIAEKAGELSGDYRRALTPGELAMETGFDEEEIREALRLTGNHIDGLVM